MNTFEKRFCNSRVVSSVDSVVNKVSKDRQRYSWWAME
jgi:hypothetical protein